MWGSGGELGIRRDGTHGQYLVVDAAYLRGKPLAVPVLDAHRHPLDAAAAGCKAALRGSPEWAVPTRAA